MATNTRPTGYNHDVFLSYSRKGNVKEWVWNHLHPKLIKCLQDHLPYDVEVFLDQTGIDPGQQWPSALRDSLSKSCVMVTVWCPKYFQSEWCMTEWMTMRKRQELISNSPVDLIYPVRFSDGVHFHTDAQLTQESRAFEDLTIPDPVFSQSVAYTQFHKAVNDMAVRLAARILKVPAWDKAWPIISHAGLPSTVVAQPQF
jgi:hypothetical protein